MILKVRAANATAIESWRYFDGVMGVHWSKYKRPSEKDLLPSKVKDVQSVYFMGGKSEFAVMVSFDGCTTGPMELWCNTEAYLMNNQGKTIERLL